MINTKVWAAVVAVGLMLSLGAALWVNSRQAEGQVAYLYQDGKLIRSIDLSAQQKAETFEIQGEWGSNVVQVEKGRIRVLEADCPDQVCVRAGWLEDQASPIVCLPHRLVIQLKEPAEAQVDTVSQ